MLEKVQKFIDFTYRKILSRISKKLFAFLVATMLLWFGKVDGDVWELITITFIGTQMVQDTAVQWKHGAKSQNPSPPSDEKGA